MKKSHIIILTGIALLIAVLLAYSADFSTWESIASAQKKPGRYVHIIAQYDKSQPMNYDPVKNPNFFSFTAKDSLGGSTKVVYRNGKPTDFEKSEGLVMKGKMTREGSFECDNILLKCPSKYKDKEKLQKDFTDQQAYGSN